MTEKVYVSDGKGGVLAVNPDNDTYTEVREDRSGGLISGLIGAPLKVAAGLATAPLKPFDNND